MVKYISDYYEELYKIFPDLRKKDILNIVNYGWKQVYLLNSYGGDVLINDRHFWCFMGKLTKNSLKHFRRYIRKMIIKFRVLYQRTQTEWDGYYYFALTKRLYANVQPNKRGRPKKYFNYGNMVFYKLLDECRIKEYNRRYIYRVPMPMDGGFTMYIPNFMSGKAELVEVREPLKFKDILNINNDYKFK